MKKFQRMHKSERPKKVAGEFTGQVRLDNSAVLWKRESKSWISKGSLFGPGGEKVWDVPFTGPIWSQGKSGDIAVASTSYWWCREGSGWIGKGYLADFPPMESIEVKDLNVRGNFSVPIVSGKIPVYDALGNLYGHIPIELIADTEDEPE